MHTKPRLRMIIAGIAAALLLIAMATATARRSSSPAAPLDDREVVLNTKVLLYHCPACVLVRHCGPDCVTVNLSEARRRGAKPCSNCGGECLARR